MIDVYDTVVQGTCAPERISTMIMDLTDKYSTLCIIRGGGSKQDLEAFSDEKVVRACFQYRTSDKNNVLICGIGHEIDNPLIELVSDIVCRTPTAVGKYLTDHMKYEKHRRYDIVRRLYFQTYEYLSHK